MTEAQTAEASGITGLMLIGVALIPWITLAISEVLLALYRRAVVRAMAGQRPARSTPSPVHASEQSHKAEELFATRDTTDNAAAAGGVLYQRFEHTTKTTTIVYVSAGFAYAALMGIALGVQSGTLSLASWWAYAVGFAWPAVLTALLITSPHWRVRLKIVGAYFVVFLLGVAVPPTRWYLLAIFFANGAATIVSLVVRARRIHAVAPLVGAVLTIVGVAMLFGVATTVLFDNGPAQAGQSSMEAGAAFLLLGLLLVLFVAGPLSAWLALRLVAAQYGRKRTSDQAIAMSALWLTFAGIQSSAIAFSDARWLAAGPVAFLAFFATASVGFRLLRRHVASAERGPRLLVLRVFALGRKSRDLFERFTTRWRRIGSVQLIAGPDLVTSTVEPHEFLDFLRRRLGHRFLDSEESVDRALEHLDLNPDPDCRYRTTDFICRDHAWRTVFGRLATASDVVMMDLRGFSRVNAGCTYEIGALLNIVPFERITIIVDGLTDEGFLAQTLEEARATLPQGSPNFTQPEMRLRVFRETGSKGVDPDRLFRLLCDAAMLSRRSDRQVAHAS
jgi:hypothetical protein